MSTSRTKNTSINMVVAVFCQVLNLILNFALQTVFIKTLGAEYLGVNGLFTNILTILSFAELGIGNAIIFSMYKPLATGDKIKIGSLMSLYKRTYCLIGCIIAGAGVLVSPFINVIIKNKPNISENITLLYLLFLCNTVISYFFVYKKSIIIADQKNYIVLVITTIVHTLRIVGQVVLLFLIRSFILYLSVQIVCTFLENLISSLIADKLYPYLKQKSPPLEKSETKQLFKNIRALAMYKFGSVVLNGTDNILISMLVGVREVGLVSNYVLLTNSCNSILTRITESFTASVGNLNASEDTSKKYEIFNKIFLITAWIYGFVSVGLIVVSKNFIAAWIGKDYVLDQFSVCAIILGFYVCGVNYVTYVYRTTLGYFVQGRMAPLVAAGLNLVLSVLLFKWVGLCGIFFATPISRLVTIGVMDPVLIYKNTFKKNPIIYYIRYYSFLVIFIINGLLCNYLNSLITIDGWSGVILRIIVVTFAFNFISLLCFGWTKTFREILKMALGVIHKRKNG